MTRQLLALTALVLGLAACSDSNAPASTEPQRISLRFAANVGTQRFVCGQSYTGLGTTNSTATATDFMLYVSDVRLLRADGAEVPLTLVQDGRWQFENIALLDFATNTGCPSATADTNLVVTGTAPAGTYTGVRFVLGVPFNRNHGDQTTAPSPLNLSRMFWSWNAGYKFVRLDLNTTGRPTGWFIHLGSTTCSPTGSATTIPTTCAEPNRPTVTLTGFDPSRNVIVADMRALVSGANLDVNNVGASGCMSAPSDTDCPPVFSSFGLPFAGATAASQSFFRVASGT
ncbi:MAG: metallo-mystery pair system four-Cys motif protein [Gemmatimonadaceae bacterium]|nr:metallo-mystery pair system four-Cys motif protein [Gemmatimonadaceae bacterium]